MERNVRGLRYGEREDTMKDVTDKLETLILMALDANHGHTVPGTLRREKSTGRVLELHDQGELLAIDEMRPAGFKSSPSTACGSD